MLSVADEKMSAANRMRYHSDLANSDMHHPETFIMKELGKMLENILINCDKLDILVTKEPAEGARRANVRVRVDQLKADIRCLQSSYASLQARRLHQEQEIRDRNSLLSMSFTTNAEAAKESKGMINGDENIIVTTQIQPQLNSTEMGLTQNGLHHKNSTSIISSLKST